MGLQEEQGRGLREISFHCLYGYPNVGRARMRATQMRVVKDQADNPKSS